MSAESVPPLAPVRPAQRRLVTRVVSDGRRLGLSVAPVDDSSAILRGLKPIWFGPRDQWLFSGEQHDVGLADSIRTAFRERPPVDLQGLGVLLRDAIEAPSPTYFTEVLDVQILPLEVMVVDEDYLKEYQTGF